MRRLPGLPVTNQEAAVGLLDLAADDVGDALTLARRIDACKEHTRSRLGGVCVRLVSVERTDPALTEVIVNRVGWLGEEERRFPWRRRLDRHGPLAAVQPPTCGGQPQDGHLSTWTLT